MAFPTIKFNNSSGSDTAASGAGPTTAVTGTAAAHTGGVSSTTITLTNSPDLSGVATDGSAALWLKTASGRQFSKITAVDNGADTVTVQDSFNIASGSAVDYAIGGKRNTFFSTDSVKIFADAKAGWTIDVEETGTDYTSAADQQVGWSTGGNSTDGVITFTSSSTTRPKIVFTGNGNTSYGFQCSFSANANYITFSNLRITRTGTGLILNGLFDLPQGPYSISIINCEIWHTNDPQGWGAGIRWKDNPHPYHLLVQGCHIHDCNLGIYSPSEGGNPGHGNVIINNTIRSNDSHGIALGLQAGIPLIQGNIITDNGGDGINAEGTSLNIIGNVIDGNAGDGIESTSTPSRMVILNNQITNNGGYGIKFSATGYVGAYFIDFNNFYNNTSGARSNVTAGANDLATDPSYTNAGSDNYEVGTAMKAKGFPKSTENIPGSTTKSYVDIGVAQREEPVGGVVPIIKKVRIPC